ncbi:BrnA antitoxin family protein [Xanthobacter sp. KR7-225]|uniref:BrnA antitoxin family protein n=1 Tax=Xanthobacter sp. KR7-225 TaxID=3156613 RepID=UPI0032B388F2
MGTRKHKIAPLTDAEEAEIQRQIAADPDDAELTDAQIAQAKPFAEAFPELMERIKRARGRPKVESPKEAVTLRLAPETVARFKTMGGKDWRAKMSEALEKAARRG